MANGTHWLLRSQSLLKAAQWFNRKVVYRMGIKVVVADNLTMPKYWPDRLLYFERLLSLLKNVQGDIVECGVASGGSLVILSILNRNSEVKRHIWGFDSFEGLPIPSEKDMSSPQSMARKGMFGQGVEEVLHNLRAAGFDEHAIRSQVTLVKGWFSEMLPKYAGPSIALLHIDADLYDSYKCALENLWPKLAVGGVAAFDEYQEPEKWPGVKKAVDEYFKSYSGNWRMHIDPFYNRYYAIRLS